MPVKYSQAPKPASYYFKRSKKRRHRQNLAGALADITKAIELEPNNPTYYMSRAGINHTLDYQSCLKDRIKRAELENDMADYHLFLGMLEYQLGNYHAAIQHMELAVEIDAISADTFAFVHTMRNSKARILISEHPAMHNGDIQNIPLSFQSWFDLAMAYNTIWQYDNAIIAFEKALQLQPDHPEATLHYCESLYWCDRYNEAISTLSRIIEITPNDHAALELRSRCHKYLRDYPNAIADFTQIIQTGGNFSENMIERAYLKFESKDYIGAAEDFSALIEFEKPLIVRLFDLSEKEIDIWNAFRHRAECKHHLGDYQGALADFAIAEKIDPTWDDLYEKRALTKIALGDIKGAMSDYNRMLRHASYKHEAYLARADFKMQLADYQSALTDYRRAKRSDPSNLRAIAGIKKIIEHSQ